jgi:hypothetical protein
LIESVSKVGTNHSSNAIKISETQIQNHLGEMTRNTAEGRLSDMLGPEADHLREDTSELERAPTGIVTSLESLKGSRMTRTVGDFLRFLKKRGFTGSQLIVSDKYPGLVEWSGECFRDGNSALMPAAI